VIAYGRAGASFVEMYTALVYNGISVVRQVKDALPQRLKGQKWVEIIGEDVRKKDGVFL